MWASLALELLYLTNDDEERYSIQVRHSTLVVITYITDYYPRTSW